MHRKTISLAILFSSTLLLGACAPEVGSEAWCKQMDKKAKGDWSANEAKDYASNCIFKK